MPCMLLLLVSTCRPVLCKLQMPVDVSYDWRDVPCHNLLAKHHGFLSIKNQGKTEGDSMKNCWFSLMSHGS